MSETILAELKRYVGFSAHDEAALLALHPLLQPRFATIAERFYQAILEHDGARKVLTEGESMVGRLKVTLLGWMEALFKGPWDDAYYELRARIGRVHVRIDLPQHYMFGAMNVLRRELHGGVHAALGQAAQAQVQDAHLALGKVLDLELAIMLHTYREDLSSAHARTERLATFGQLVGSIGHELRNPLGVMETSLYILRGRAKEDERSLKHIDRIAEQLGIANSIITDLLDMIRDKPLSRQRLAPARLWEKALGAVRRPERLQLELIGLDALPDVEGDETQLRQVFVNLLDNAVFAAGELGRITVEGRAEEAMVAIAIEDSGPGVKDAIRRRLFEPLVTNKVKGVGLGLALVKRIVERHQGSIVYEPRKAGARFVVRLPRAN